MTEAGTPVPAFEMPTDSDGTISSESLKGQKYVIYFYPKDGTPGCTAEACGDGLEQEQMIGGAAMEGLLEIPGLSVVDSAQPPGTQRVGPRSPISGPQRTGIGLGPLGQGHEITPVKPARSPSPETR